MADHPTEFQGKTYNAQICKDPDCEFYGHPAQQGTCHSNEPEVAHSFERLEKLAEDFAEELVQIRKIESFQDKDEYIRWLESTYECAMMNWTFCLDECIRLRKENGDLKRKHEGNAEAPKPEGDTEGGE